MWDQELFLFLNFDGGDFMDSLMVGISSIPFWLPLYFLILGLVWYKSGWKTMLLLFAALALAVGVSDIVTGIFKHSGLLKHLLPDSFPFRLRPMHNEEIQDLIHVVKGGGRFGTVSAHAATAFSIGYLATRQIALRWFSVIMWTQVVLVCYSRIYLSSHYPQDILLGIGFGWFFAYLSWLLFKWAEEKFIKNENTFRR